MIILVMGLPGSGKTTLAEALVKRLNAVHLNADEMRLRVNKGLGFSMEGRMEQARRMGAVAEIISRAGIDVVVDFVCPTFGTRMEFAYEAGDNFKVIVWMDTIEEGRFPDTNQLFEPVSEREPLPNLVQIRDWKYDINEVIGMMSNV